MKRRQPVEPIGSQRPHEATDEPAARREALTSLVEVGGPRFAISMKPVTASPNGAAACAECPADVVAGEIESPNCTTRVMGPLLAMVRASARVRSQRALGVASPGGRRLLGVDGWEAHLAGGLLGGWACAERAARGARAERARGERASRSSSAARAPAPAGRRRQGLRCSPERLALRTVEVLERGDQLRDAGERAEAHHRQHGSRASAERGPGDGPWIGRGSMAGGSAASRRGAESVHAALVAELAAQRLEHASSRRSPCPWPPCP